MHNKEIIGLISLDKEEGFHLLSKINITLCLLILISINTVAGSLDYDLRINGMFFKRLNNSQKVKLASSLIGNGKITIPRTFIANDTTFTVTRIGASAFLNNSSIKRVTLPNSIEWIESKAFSNCGISYFTVPDSVTYIATGAFSFCMNLKSIYIGKMVKTIGKEAFSSCPSLEEIHVSNEKPVTDLGIEVFRGIDKRKCVLHVPVGTKQAYENAEQWKDFIFIVEDSPTKIQIQKNPYADNKTVFYSIYGQEMRDDVKGVVLKVTMSDNHQMRYEKVYRK
nr:leucine-rich repeat domain-containing protein [Prevotella sp.]